MAFGARQGAFLASAAVILVASAPAIAQQRQFNVPAQDARTGIPEFARQAGIQISAPTGHLGNKRTNAVQGSKDVSAALAELIEGTGLTVGSNDGRMVVLQLPSAVGNAFAGAPNAGEKNSDQSSGEGATLVAGGVENERGIADILVVGRKTQNVDIRRTENDAQPYVVFSHDDITKSGASNLDEFLQTRLPQNNQTYGSQAFFNRGQTSGSLNLRGLGTNNTLILVDGRRIAGVATTTDFQQPVIAGISPYAVERIEVLPSTASAIYGGGATGGVINIILRHDYSGLDVNGTFGASTDGKAPRFQIGLNGGLSFNGGHTRISAGFNHSEQKSLYQGDRPFLREWSQRNLRNDPTRITPPDGMSLPNICIAASSSPFAGCSATPTNLILDPAFGGSTIGSPYTYVPAGYLGPSSDLAQAFVRNSGMYSYAGRGSPIMNGIVSNSAQFTVRQDITRHLEAFLNLSGDNSSINTPGPIYYSAVLAASSPLNPFQQDIRVTQTLPGVDATYKSKNYSLRAGAGLIAHLPYRWGVTLEYDWNRARTRVEGDTFSSFASQVLSPAASAIYSSLVLSDPATWPAISKSQLLYRTNFIKEGSTFQNASLRASGPGFALPGGDVTFTGLIEARKEVADDFHNTFVDQTGTVTIDQLYPSATRKIHSYYAEALVPLVSAKNAIPLIKEAELTASIRRDAYDTLAPHSTLVAPFPSTWVMDRNKVASTDYLVAVRYAPARGLMFRGSFGTGFVPPTISQITSPTTQVLNLSTRMDPQRGNTPLPTSVSVILGGNSGLVPEQSKSFSYGMILSPESLKGFRFSVDYTRVRKRNEISSITLPTLLADPVTFSGRIVRGPNLPGDQPGWAGPIQALDLSFLNVNRSESSAIDFQFDYAVDTGSWGRWHLYAIATDQLSLKRAFAANGVAVDQVGLSNGVLKWRGNGGLEWSKGPWSAQWNVQYYDSYNVCGPTDAASTCNAARVQAGRSNNRSQMFHDFQVTWRGSRGALADTELSIGINNIFNSYELGNDAVTQSNGGLAPYGDPRLRRFYVTLNQHFGGH